MTGGHTAISAATPVTENIETYARKVSDTHATARGDGGMRQIRTSDDWLERVSVLAMTVPKSHPANANDEALKVPTLTLSIRQRELTLPSRYIRPEN